MELAARYFAVDAFYNVSGDMRPRSEVFEASCTVLGIDSSSALAETEM